MANGARLTQNHAFPERAPNILPRRLEIHLTGTHHGRTLYANKMFPAFETVEVYYINVTATQRPKWVSSLLHDENCRLLLNAG